jgi:hypothetical protein
MLFEDCSCISVTYQKVRLGDGTGRDPLETHNFGNAAKYLVRPCQNEDGSNDEECTINFGSVAISSEDQAIIDSIKGKGIINSETVVAFI